MLNGASTRQAAGDAFLFHMARQFAGSASRLRRRATLVYTRSAEAARAGPAPGGARGGPLRPVVALSFCSRIAAATASGAAVIVSPTNSGVFRALSHAAERDTQV